MKIIKALLEQGTGSFSLLLFMRQSIIQLNVMGLKRKDLVVSCDHFTFALTHRCVLCYLFKEFSTKFLG